MLSSSNRQLLIWIVLTVPLLAHSLLANAQEKTPADPATQTTLRGGAQEVLLDIVVRDKKGRPVKNLAAKDFEITDDGERQKIRGFRMIDGKDKDAAAADAVSTMMAAAGQANAIDALRQIRIVTLVFGRLDTDGRNNARVAVEELLKTETGPNLFFAVFSIDQRLSVLQPYTTDKERIRKAVAKVTSSASSAFKTESDQIKDELKTLAVQQGVYGESPLPIAGGRTPAPISSNSVSDIALAKLLLNMMEFSQATDRTIQGRSDLFSLQALIGQQYSLPGRKTLLYFCGGLMIPPDYTDEFQHLISDANRFNVSVYGIDVRSLDSESKNALGNTLLKQAALASQIASNDGPVTRDQVIGVDRATESIQANSQNSLADISQKTGGFMVANTDVRNQLHRVTEDIDTHYELAYGPDIRNFDGHFRKISVRVNRPDVQVQSRAGYFAVPLGGGEPLRNYELPLLGALAAAELPREVRFRSSALRFQSIDGEQESVVVFDVPLEGMAFAVDEKTQSYRVHFSVLALIKNADGVVVRKVSQDIPRQGPLGRMEAVKMGHFIYSQHAPLPPGRYTLETVVADKEAGKVGAKKSVLLISPASGALGLSSVVRVRSFTPSAAGDPAPAPDPFQTPNGKISPGLDDVVKGGPGSSLSFFFTAYADRTAPQLTIEFLRDGQLLARSQPSLPTPDSHGQMPYVVSTPLDAFHPGEYEMRVTIAQNGKSASERTVFTVE